VGHNSGNDLLACDGAAKLAIIWERSQIEGKSSRIEAINKGDRKKKGEGRNRHVKTAATVGQGRENALRTERNEEPPLHSKRE